MSVMKVCTMMEELPKTLMGGLKIYLKVHLITRRVHSTRWSIKDFQIKIGNESWFNVSFLAKFVENKTRQNYIRNILEL